MSVSFSVQTAAARPDPKAVLTLLKPVTWFPPMWAFTCGAISAGVPLTDRKALLALGIGITGPLLSNLKNRIILKDTTAWHVTLLREPFAPGGCGEERCGE
jgi:chlorophyll synthase